MDTCYDTTTIIIIIVSIIIIIIIYHCPPVCHAAVRAFDVTLFLRLLGRWGNEWCGTDERDEKCVTHLSWSVKESLLGNRGLGKGRVNVHHCSRCGNRGSVVDTAAGYGLENPGIESRWRRDFRHPFRPALGPTQPPCNWHRVYLPEIKRLGRSGDHLPRYNAEVKERVEVPTIWAFTACCRVNFTSL